MHDCTSICAARAGCAAGNEQNFLGVCTFGDFLKRAQRLLLLPVRQSGEEKVYINKLYTEKLGVIMRSDGLMVK